MTGLLQLEVLRKQRLSPHFMRITLGRGDVERFVYQGFDQWFRLFIPVSEDSLSRAPQKLTRLSYVKYLTVAKSSRPLLRNYTVRAYRPDGPELDVDFALHGNGTAGPATAWATNCGDGDRVGIIDEGIGFKPPGSLRRFLLVADESGLPAAAGILASLPSDARGQAVLEIPGAQDKQELVAPSGIEVTWLARDDESAVPGRKALAEVLAMSIPDEPFYAWAVGEQSLPVALRRHWVQAGVPKEHIKFCGYWR